MKEGGNPQNLKPFKKGDPRINRNGRPKSFDSLRKLAQQIAHEEAKNKDGRTIEINGRIVTMTEAILRQWSMSKDPRLQQRFMEVAYGKVPEAVDVTSGGDKITFHVKLNGDEND